MGLVLYYDLLSQPSRAIYFFLKLNKIPFEGKKLDLVNGEHKQKAYTEVNPAQTVPFLIDDKFKLTESVAILRYIAVSKNVPEHWYPRKDAQKMARVDEFLNWHHTGLRSKCVSFFVTTLRSKIGVGVFTKIDEDKAKISQLKADVEKVVATLDERFLQAKPFIAGDEISAADLIGFNELKQLDGVNQAEIYEKNKNVGAWMKRVAAKLGPVLDEGKAVVDGVKDMYVKAK